MINEFGLNNIKLGAQDNLYETDNMADYQSQVQKAHFYHNYIKLTPFLASVFAKSMYHTINQLTDKIRNAWKFENLVNVGTLKATRQVKHYENLANLLISYTNYILNTDWINISCGYNIDNILAVVLNSLELVIKHDKDTLNRFTDLDNAVDYKMDIKQNKRLYKIFRRAIRNYNRHGEVHFTKAMRKKLDKQLNLKPKSNITFQNKPF